MRSELAPIAHAIPRVGELLPATDGPAHSISERAKGYWRWLAETYGVGKLQQFGDWPPESICKLLDQLTQKAQLLEILEEIKQAHNKGFPPSVPEQEAIIRKRLPQIDWAKLREQLTDHVMRTRGKSMTQSQQIGIPRWNWYQNGVWIPPADGAEGFFVPFTALGDSHR